MTMIKENIELVGSVEIAKDVERKIRNTGVRGMDMQKAKELGFFDRISNLLCACHATVVAAYHIYGYVDYMLTDYGARKNDIAKSMNDYERAFDKFMRFWTDYYAHGVAGEEVNNESEGLYHRIMEWAQLPEKWTLGDKQRIDDDSDVAIKIGNEEDGYLYFHKTVTDKEEVGESKESWCVTKYEPNEYRQTTVNTDMDKASAMMVAKRLSEEDPKNIYTASIVRKCSETHTTVTPFKAFQNNATIGKITKVKDK